MFDYTQLVSLALSVHDERAPLPTLHLLGGERAQVQATTTVFHLHTKVDSEFGILSSLVEGLLV